jgi:hypothetical protein
MSPATYKSERQLRGTLKGVAALLGIHWTTLARRESGVIELTTEMALAIRSLPQATKRRSRKGTNDPHQATASTLRPAVDVFHAAPCSDSVPLPICLLRMVVQVEDTPANRTALSVAKAQLLRDTAFEGVQNVVKMEQLAVISMCKPNERTEAQPPENQKR